MQLYPKLILDALAKAVSYTHLDVYKRQGFCTVNVFLMTLGLFSLIGRLSLKGKNAACKLLSDISVKSYGMYLAHILFLNFYYGLFKSISDAAYVTIPLITVCTFITVYIFIYLSLIHI